MSEESVLDVRGLKCPLPVLKARKALSKLAPGDRLLLIADDPLAVIDVPHYCQESGNPLIEQASDGGDHRFVIERA